nr:MAG TPA: Integrase [Caudoviricetes sp.]
MQCINCNREIPDNSLFCNWCGKKQIKEKAAKSEIRVPQPRILPSGKAFIQLRIGGQSISITEDTPARCKAKAQAIKAGLLEKQKQPQDLTVGEAVDRFIASGNKIFSPSTIKAYKSYRKCRFQQLMKTSVLKVNKPILQQMVNNELEEVNAKTVRNAFSLISASLKAYIKIPDMDEMIYPKVVKKEKQWLDYNQILVFLEAIKGKSCELAALLALHSLRRSEILGLRAKDIDLARHTISIRGSAVIDEHNQLIRKEETKNNSSRRTIPIMIPRAEVLLIQLIKNAQPEETFLSTHPHALYKQINKICRAAYLPEIGVHGLRHSFASLAYHLGMTELEAMAIGGWSDYQTMREIYTHLSKSDLKNAENKMAAFYKNANANANKI